MILDLIAGRALYVLARLAPLFAGLAALWVWPAYGAGIAALAGAAVWLLIGGAVGLASFTILTARNWHRL